MLTISSGTFDVERRVASLIPMFVPILIQSPFRSAASLCLETSESPRNGTSGYIPHAAASQPSMHIHRSIVPARSAAQPPALPLGNGHEASFRSLSLTHYVFLRSLLQFGSSPVRLGQMYVVTSEHPSLPKTPRWQECTVNPMPHQLTIPRSQNQVNILPRARARPASSSMQRRLAKCGAGVSRGRLALPPEGRRTLPAPEDKNV